MRQISDLWPGERFRMAGWNCVWQRWRYPTGLFVAVLAPDEAGKSTLIQHLRENLAGAFRRTEVFHLRPGVMGPKGTNGPVTDPHGKPLRSWWLSLLKIPYYLLDYGLGYLFKVRPRLVRSTLVLFDRYYDDLLVDPLRYWYGGPMGLARLARIFIPRPDLVLILDVGEEPLLVRKQELSPEEVKRQREAYRHLAAELPNAILLDGSRPPGEIAHCARKVSLDYLHERHLKRRSVRSLADGSETLKWLGRVFSSEQAHFAFSNVLEGSTIPHGSLCRFGWVALNNGRGYLVPLDSRRAAVQTLNLYNAQNLTARLRKRLLATGLWLGISQRLLRTVWGESPPGVSGRKATDVHLLEYLKKILKCRDLSFAVRLGTLGSHRKPVLQALTSDGRTLAFIKVGWNEATNALVRHEGEILQQFATASLQSFTVPKVVYADWWNGHFVCAQSAPEGKLSSAPQEMTARYMNILKELAALHIQWTPLQKSAFWKRLLAWIHTVPNPHYRHVLHEGVSMVKEWAGDEPLPFQFSHGDLAPWNAMQVNGKLFLFDWEYANSGAPAGWDLFHFLVQTQWLLKGRSPGGICRAFQRSASAHRWTAGYLKAFGLEARSVRYLFLLYLLERLAFYASEDSASFQQLQHLAMMVSQVVGKGESFNAKRERD